MKDLISAVIQQLDCDSNEELIDTLTDVVSYGADTGVNGFIYYSETVEFFTKNRKLILDVLIEEANDFGRGLTEYVTSFKCLQGYKDYEIMQVLLCNSRDLSDDQVIIANCLTWYALETVAYYVTEVCSNSERCSLLEEEGE